MQLISKEITDILYSARQKLHIHTYIHRNITVDQVCQLRNCSHNKTFVKKSRENIQLFSA